VCILILWQILMIRRSAILRRCVGYLLNRGLGHGGGMVAWVPKSIFSVEFSLPACPNTDTNYDIVVCRDAFQAM
jgi:hypothetical protein